MFGNNNLFCFIDFATKRGKSLSITTRDTKYHQEEARINFSFLLLSNLKIIMRPGDWHTETWTLQYIMLVSKTKRNLTQMSPA